MKVLTIITRGDAIGGAQTHVIALNKLLLKNGHEVLVAFGGKNRGVLGDWLADESIPFQLVKCLKREISPLFDLLAFIELILLVRKYNPQVIALHSTKAGILGRMLKLVFNIPIILTVHGWSFSPGIPLFLAKIYELIERFFARLLDKIIVVSDFDYNLAVQKSIGLLSQFVIIHNGIDLSSVSRNKRNLEVVNLVMIARFDDQKDHATLIHACQRISGVMLHLLGDGPKLQETKRLVRDLGMHEKVEFWGYTKDVSKALQTADIFLLISNWEGFPISTLEAMNASLPLLVSDVGGACEAIIEGENGYCIPRANREILSQKIIMLRDDLSLRLSMGARSKEIVSDKFSLDSMYNATVAEYQVLIKQK